MQAAAVGLEEHPGTCRAEGAEARGEALRVAERGRQTAGVGAGTLALFV